MWLPTSLDSIDRRRLTLLAYSTVGIASLAGVAYAGYRVGLRRAIKESEAAAAVLRNSPGGRLHRSNAVRHSHRPQQQLLQIDAQQDEAPQNEGQGANQEGQGENQNVQNEGQGENQGQVENQGATALPNGHHHETNGNENTPGPISLQDPPYPDTDDHPTQSERRAGHNIVSLLFSVSEDNAKRNSWIHRGTRCNSCGTVPIRGVRYHCANCPDFDLCESCESYGGNHIRSHILYKIRIPCRATRNYQPQPVWYTGDPNSSQAVPPSKQLIARLTTETGLERTEIEAFWEQWTFMANTEWPEDPDGTKLAMDRPTFDRCMMPAGSAISSPNLLHDRIFAFYDTNHDGLISFSEWLHGLTYANRKDKALRVFDLYDLDHDGYASRRDFLRLFRAHYVLYQDMFRGVLDGMNEQRMISQDARRAVHGRQPLSSLYGVGDRLSEQGDSPRLLGKVMMGDGSVRLQRGYESVVRPLEMGTMNRNDFLLESFALTPQDSTEAASSSRGDGQVVVATTTTSPPFGPFDPEPVQGDSTYAEALLDPPSDVDEIPELISGNAAMASIMSTEDDEAYTDDEWADAAVPPPHSVLNPYAAFLTGYSPNTAELQTKHRRKAANSHIRARRRLCDRWARRRFYLDEEEGATEPENWKPEEDIMATLDDSDDNGDHSEADSAKNGESSKARLRSRSSSKVRFAEGPDDGDALSVVSGSSRRSVPERWGGFDIPCAERDAGKEIIYQVTQQAFNELLDTIFQSAEDVAMQAALSKADRVRYKRWIDALGPDDVDPAWGGYSGVMREGEGDGEGLGEGVGQALGETVRGIVENRSREGEEAAVLLEILQDGRDSREQENQEKENSSQENHEKISQNDQRLPDGYDPTLPQFLPNAPPPPPQNESPLPPLPDGISKRDLIRWRHLAHAEEEARRRGGWALVSRREFVMIWDRNHSPGVHLLAYLEAWIELCLF